MTIFCFKNVDPDPDPQINMHPDLDPAQKQSIFSENGLFFIRIRIRMRIHKINAVQVRCRGQGTGEVCKGGGGGKRQLVMRDRIGNSMERNTHKIVAPVKGG